MTTRMIRRVLGAALAAVICMLAFGASPAAAHAALTGTDPKDGSVVKSAPKQVTLSFSEGVQLSADSVRVLDPQGRDTAKGEAEHVSGDTKTASVALNAGLPDGTFTVAWKAVSEDSHPIAGAFTFSIGAPSETSVALDEGVDSGIKTLYDSGRYLAYSGFVLLVGGCVFAGVCGGRTRAVRRVATGGWALLFAATVALLLLRGPYTGTDFGLTEVREILATKPGAALLSRLLLLGAAAVFLAVLFGSYERREDPKERRDLAYGLGIGGAVIAAGLAATWAMAEHASAGIQPWLAMPVTALHLMAVSVWLGGLVSLAMTMRFSPGFEPAVVRRFSRLAFISVLVLVVTGLYQAWRGVGSWGALTATTYGQLLLVKVGLVAVLVGTAWISRRWTSRLGEAGEQAGPVRETVTVEAKAGAARTGTDSKRERQLARQRNAVDATRERRARDADADRRGLRKSVLVEVAIAVVLLSVTTSLTGTQPGRAETEAAQAGAASAAETAGPLSVKIPFDTDGRNGQGTAELTLDPGSAGDNTLHTYLTNANNELLDVPEVKIAFTLKSKNIGPLRVALDKVDAGHWSASGVQLPMAGEWSVALTVRSSDIDQVTVSEKIKIG